MARPRRPDPHKERHWRQLVDQWRRSGQGVRAFCQARGLSEQSLYWWRRELAARDRRPATPEAAAPPPRFVAVRVRAEPAAGLPAGLVEVVWGNGRRLRAGADVDPRRLAALVAALEGSAC